ncbi:uncharacterized protein B0H18DRAFT_1220702 [Fomitopsis serialis]|uniref:uncharacterized protein n=1 Tax=Fomitopsis serialis TaxID=139415 RepID=UPI00200722A2|nr:uncharacterized protein B0H18DRAFT_1220702 [Neoantrodia serialis]KAH9905515.1 hypothetical protein B0H18DRAFT_1220702 [Neoantrodia serialis]
MIDIHIPYHPGPGLFSPVYLLSVCSVLVVYALWKLAHIIAAPYRSSLRYLPAPPSSSWLYGNLKDISAAEARSLHERWVEQYGNTITYKGLLNANILYTIDTRAVNHILSHSVDYCKPAPVRFALSQLLGKGLLFVEGDQHHQQRRVMNPAFGPGQIRELTDIFILKANKVRQSRDQTY